MAIILSVDGQTDFSVNRNEIIKAALRKINKLGEGKQPSPEMITDGAQALNMIVKQWQGQADFAPGLKTWTRKRGVIFLEKGKASYQLGTDQATTSYIETTCKVAAVATDTTIDVNSIVGIANVDYIVIVMDDGNVHTTRVNGAPAGDTVTLSDQLTAAVSVGNKIWVYTSKMQRPLQILHAYLRDSDGNDTPLDKMSLDRYETLPDKDVSSTPTAFYFEKERADATIYLDAGVEDVTDVLHLTFLRPIEDFDASTDEPDYPQNWFRALMYQLAIDIAPEYGVRVTQDLKDLRNESVAIAQNSDPEESELYYQPELD